METGKKTAVGLSSSSSPPLIDGKTFTQLFAELGAKVKAQQNKPPDADSKPAQRVPSSFRNGIVRARVHRDRDAFIASISDGDVCHLASQYHDGESCTLFKSRARGSYNICYFVQFGSGDRWVVRVPLTPTLALTPADKLESEVAVMRLLAERTTIPGPKIHAYALGDGAGPFPSFLILEYVEGQKINYAQYGVLSEDQRMRLYTSLADIYIQLRQLEFPLIGRLKQGPYGPVVGKRTATADFNMQELEGLRPSAIQDFYCGVDGTLDSANRYMAMLLDIADNAFAGSRGSVSDEEEGGDRFYHLHMFREYAEKWVDGSVDRGPFVLVHGDLEIFNLILDDDMNVVSVLDWEWSCVVPLQLFKPPLWLSNAPVEDMCYGYRYRDYLERFDEFLAILRTREQAKYGNQLLAGDWNRRRQRSGFMVAYALETWTAMDWFANRYINLRVYGGKGDLKERVAAFM